MVLLLDPYVDAVLLLALAFLIVGIMRSLSPFLQKIPWVGGAIANAAEGMASAISRACFAAFSAIDHALGVSLHGVARFVDHTYQQFRSHARLILDLATLGGVLAFTLHGLRALVHRLEHAGAGVGTAVKTLEKEYHGIEHRVRDLERKVAHGIGHDLRIRIKALEKEYTGLEEQTIPGLRSAVNTAEGDLASLREWLGVKVGVGYKEWAIALATTLLAAIGLSGLRCNSLANALRNRGCGLWSGLEDLLGLLFDAVILVDLCQLLPELERLFAAFEAPIVDLTSSAADAICAQPPQGWVELAAPPAHAPRVYYAGPVPGN